MDSCLPLRRRLLAACAAAVAAPLFVRDARSQPRLHPTPSQGEGPFYPVSLPADTDFDLLTQGGTRYGHGQVAWIEGRVTDTGGKALSGAVVELWQCDHQGRYHHPRERQAADAAFQGFGRVIVGRDGAYRFRAMRPVAYPGRTPHVHFKVKLGQRELLTTQLYVEGDPGNVQDWTWRRLSGRDREALTRPFQPGEAGLHAEFPIVVEA